MCNEYDTAFEYKKYTFCTTTLQAIACWDGIIKLPADGKLTLSEYQNVSSGVDPAVREKCRENLRHDQKDCGSPSGMTIY